MRTPISPRGPFNQSTVAYLDNLVASLNLYLSAARSAQKLAASASDHFALTSALSDLRVSLINAQNTTRSIQSFANYLTSHPINFNC